MKAQLPAVPDAHRWLEEDSEQARGWVGAHDERAAAYLADLAGRDEAHTVLRRMTITPARPPTKATHGRAYRLLKKKSPTGWRLEIRHDDGMTVSLDLPATIAHEAIHRWTPSPTGRHLALQHSIGGSEASTPLLILDLKSGAIVESTNRTRYSPVLWRADGKAFFYVRFPADSDPGGVWLHRIGTEWSFDKCIFSTAEPLDRYHVVLFHDRWLLISARHGAAPDTKNFYVDLDGPPVCRRLLEDVGTVYQCVVTQSGSLLALTSGEPADRVLTAQWDGRKWGKTDVTLAGPLGVQLESLTLIDQHTAIVLGTVDGYSNIYIVSFDTDEHSVRPVTLPGPGTVRSVNHNQGTGLITLSYTDWSTPPSTWRLDLTAGSVEELPGAPGPRSAPVTVVRTTYPSFDSTLVPLTLLRPPSAGPSDPLPTLITCYGGFGISFRSTFQPELMSWIQAGGAAAVVGVRGGGERGPSWHNAGRLRHKGVAIKDLHAASCWLIDHGHAKSGSLALIGGSNGGMVAMSAAVLHPGTYAAVACGGAPLDLARYPLWGLGPSWVSEYGDPTNPDDLKALLSYSPYHNVDDRRGSLPAVLLSAGSDDTRVAPLHSYKMMAAMEGANGGTRHLRVIAGGGHVSGGSMATAAEIIAFLGRHVGLTFDSLSTTDQ